MSSDFSNSSNQLIDMLISSLYSYQIKNSDRQLDIFIDEIQNQNLSENAPIARTGDRARSQKGRTGIVAHASRFRHYVLHF